MIRPRIRRLLRLPIRRRDLTNQDLDEAIRRDQLILGSLRKLPEGVAEPFPPAMSDLHRASEYRIVWGS